MTNSDDFQRRNLNSVGRVLCTNLKNEGDVMTKNDDFHGEEFKFGWQDFRYINLTI